MANLKLNQIPTKNKVIVIDNYSSTWNYIVEDDKIYASKKGEDSWRDISDNETARHNLLTFINDKYDFKGYEDRERALYQNSQVQASSKVTKQQQQQNNLALKLDQIPTKNKLIVIDNYSPKFDYIVEDNKIYYTQKGRNHWIDISDNDKARQNLMSYLSNNYNFKGYEDREREIYEAIKNGTFNYNTYDTVSPRNTSTVQLNKVKKKEDKKKISSPKKKVNFISVPDVELKFQTPFDTYIGSHLKVNNPGDFGALWNNILDGNWGDIWGMIKNKITRVMDMKKGGSDDPVSNFVVPEQPQTSSLFGIIPASVTGDTIRDFNQRISDQQYIIPESLDVKDYKFGYRNRGNHTPIQTEAASITAFNSFMPYGQHNKNFKTYIGIDSSGQLKVGDISQFGDGDYLTGTYSNEIASFMKDKDGNIIMTKSVKNPAQNQPAYVIWDNGKLVEKPNGQAINILVRKDDPIGNQYGNVTGGRVLVKVGNEIRLLSGSVQDIDRQFEDMKKRHNADHGTFYTLDNGSFNRGLRTYSRQLTSDELKSYDRLNSTGGNFLYISEPSNTFRSDTIRTPHIRTEVSKSYQAGHPLVNEQKGIVLHHTGQYNTFNDIVQDLTTPLGQVIPWRGIKQTNERSAHVIISEDGNRTVLATPDQVTFHAGKSAWNGRLNVNDFMIGIEFQGDTNVKDLTPQQIQSAVEYMLPLIRKNNIRLEDITTHQQIRDLYIDYARKSGDNSEIDTKPDINARNYQKIIDALLARVYYDKQK